MCFGMLVARYGRFFDAFLRAFVLWRIARALRQGFRRIFLRAFYVLWYIGCTPRGGFSTFLRVFLFLWEVSRVLARSLQSGDDGKKQIAKRQVRYENKRQKRQKRGEDVKKVNAKEKEKEKVKDSERESKKKRRTKSDAPL